MNVLDIEEKIAALARAEALPAQYPAMALRWFKPLADWLCAQREVREDCLLVGLNGAQGTGKTTLCKMLALFVETRGYRLLTLGLDDFYLGLPARERLASQVHPLLRTRGVPGTHETALLIATLDKLRAGADVVLPVFDKAIDDRVPPEMWRREKPADIVILEGWCVGVGPESEAALAMPVNALEAEEDSDGTWRRFVNDALINEYAELFGMMHKLVMLEAPSLNCVLEWRRLQEEKLARRRSGGGVMDPAAVRRFVQHYERLTRHGLKTLPDRANYLLKVAQDHSIAEARAQ